MRTRWAVAALVAALGLPAVTVEAAEDPRDENRYIVRIDERLNGLTTIELVCRLVGCDVRRPLDADSGGSVFLVDSLLPLRLDDFLGPLLRLLGVASAERDLRLALAGDTRVDQESDAMLDYLWRRTPTSYYGTTVWEGYLEQPAVSIIRLAEAQRDFGATGTGVVAIIDTGVDPSHPALSKVIVPGYDFTRNTPGGDERADLGQESAAVLDQESAAVLDDTDPHRVNQESAAVLDQESAAVLDNPDFAAFGHGTMVAGVVHLAAPTAGIMPLKAFRADGTGYTSDIVRAIYYAAARGVKVVNMSFSRATPSPEIARAVNLAVRAGALPVASAGNEGVRALRWPAALANVVGVASTRNSDVRSRFSNYGSDLVWLSAPGEGVITTFPLGSYAAVWGTSFSTPFVAGAAALLASTADSYSDAATALGHAKALRDADLGCGRLDVYEVVRAKRRTTSSLLGLLSLASREATCEAR
ncbi:MAG: S8 family serine peptidase [Vicinamibacteria bacterium]